MVEIDGVPVIAYLLGWLVKYDVRKVILSCGYQWQVLRSALGTGDRWGLEIQYAVEPERLGRGGGIRFALQSAGLAGSDAAPVLVANGDNLVDFDLDAMLQEHGTSRGLATVALVPLVSARGIVETDRQGRVTGFREKPELPYWINAGVYVLDASLADRFPVKGDHEDELFPQLAAEGQLVAYKTRQLWRTVDTAKDLTALTRELRGGLSVPCLDWTRQGLA